MRRRLILLRHAKSSWSDPSLTDHDRPLNRRGRKEAPLVARGLAERRWVPELVVSSDSTRTRETWKRMRKELPEGIEVQLTSRLYAAGLEAIREESLGWDDGLRTVLVLGHNPGWEEALAELTGKAEHMTTANAALLEGRGESWSSALQAPWDLVEIVRPPRDAE